MTKTVGSRAVPVRPRVAFLGFVMSEETMKLVLNIDPAPAVQTQRFGSMMAGLLERASSRFSSYNFVPVQDYPVARKIVFRGERFLVGNYAFRSLPFINLLVLKHASRFAALLRHYPSLTRHDVLVVHGLHVPNLAVAVLVRLAGVRAGVVLTDEQGIVLPTDGAIRRALKRLDRLIVTRLSTRLDFSIALSPDLAALYTPGKPTLMLPGVYSTELEGKIGRCAEADEHDGSFRALYFGGLSAEYGVQALLDAVPHLPPCTQIRLFGRGPLEEAAAALAVRDARLHWGGMVDQDHLAREMAASDLLINARPADGRLARMSSPSKLLEYAASGKLVATTRLPTIDPAVLAACVAIEEPTGMGVAAAVDRAASMPLAERSRLGGAFRDSMRARFSPDGLVPRVAALFSATQGRPST